MTSEEKRREDLGTSELEKTRGPSRLVKIVKMLVKRGLRQEKRILSLLQVLPALLQKTYVIDNITVVKFYGKN